MTDNKWYHVFIETKPGATKQLILTRRAHKLSGRLRLIHGRRVLQHICLFIVKHLLHTAARCIEHYVHNTLLSNKPGLVAFSNAIMFLSHQNFMSPLSRQRLVKYGQVVWIHQLENSTTGRIKTNEIYDLKIGGQVFWKSYKRNNLKTRRHEILRA